MSASTHDCLIIGQGLAGSLLARELIAMKQRVLVVDDYHQSSSSTVAGGLINPVTGKRLTLQPGIDYLLPAAQRLYRTIEQKARRHFFYPLPMLRIFQDEEERGYFERRGLKPTIFFEAERYGKNRLVLNALGDYRGAPDPDAWPQVTVAMSIMARLDTASPPNHSNSTWSLYKTAG